MGDRDPKNYSDERTVQVTVVFNPDAVYRIEDVLCMDQADLTAQNTVYEGQEPYQEFTVDHQIPEGTVSVSIGKDSVWENLWSVITTAWTYATPLFYPVSILPDWMMAFEQFNPMYHYVTYFRDIALWGVNPGMQENLICLGFAIVTFAVGFLVFKKLQKRFILYV